MVFVRQRRPKTPASLSTTQTTPRVAMSRQTMTTHSTGYKVMHAIVLSEETYTAQCTWLRQTVHKPMQNTIREFVYCIEEVNAYQKKFPVEEGQMATPLNDLKLKELMFRAIPRKWHLKLTEKGFRRHKLTCQQFLAEIKNVQSVEMQTRAMESKKNKSQKGKHRLNDCAQRGCQ